MKSFAKLALGLVVAFAMIGFGLPGGAWAASAANWGPYKSQTINGASAEGSGTVTVSGAGTATVKVEGLLTDKSGDAATCGLAVLRWNKAGTIPFASCSTNNNDKVEPISHNFINFDYVEVRICLSNVTTKSTPIAGSCGSWKELYEKPAQVFEDDWGPYYSGKYKARQNYVKGHVEVENGDLTLEGKLYDKVLKYCAIAIVKVTTGSDDEQEFTHCGGGYGAVEVEESDVKQVRIKVCAYDEDREKAFKCGSWKSVYED